MYRMSEDKSPDVRKRLSQELTHSLFRADEDVMNYDVDEVKSFLNFPRLFIVSHIFFAKLSFQIYRALLYFRLVH